MIDRTDPTNRDTVPAMLTPGEFVVNKEASQMYGPVIESMNNAGLQKRAMKNNMVSANMGSSIPPKYLNLGGGSVSERDEVVRVPLMSTIKQHEGYRDYVYNDGFGNPTIGYGHLLPDSYKKFMWDGKDEKTKHKPYSETELDELLVSDLAIAEKGAQNNFDNWSQLPKTVQDGLTNMSFQLGAAGQAKFVKMKDAVEANDFTEAAKQAKDSKWHTETPTRSTHLANIFLDQTPERSSDVLAPGYGEMTPQDFLDQAETFNTPGSAMLIPQSNPAVANVPNTMLSSNVEKDPSFVPAMREAPPIFANPSPDIAADPKRSPPLNRGNSGPIPFNEAFKKAREEMGAGQVFKYNGNKFSTNYAEEEEMMGANMGAKVCDCGKKSVCDCGGVQKLNLGDYVLNMFGDNSILKDEDLLRKSSQAAAKEDAIKRQVEMQKFMEYQKQQRGIPNNQIPMTYDLETRKMGDPSYRQQASDNELFGGPLNYVNDAPTQEEEIAMDEAGVDALLNEPPAMNVPINPPNIPTPRLDDGLRNSPPPTFMGDVVPYAKRVGSSLLNTVKNDLSNYTDNLPESLKDSKRMMEINKIPEPKAAPINTDQLIQDVQTKFLTAEAESNINYLKNKQSNSTDVNEIISLDAQIKDQTDALQVTKKNMEDNEIDKIRRKNMSPIVSQIQESADRANVSFDQLATKHIANVEKEKAEIQAILSRTNSNLSPEATTALTKKVTSLDALVAEITGSSTLPPAKVSPSNKLANKQMVQSLTAQLQQLDDVQGSDKSDPGPDNLPKPDPKEIPEAEATLKSFFGDIFDSKELKRAALLYLGARMTGLNGNQALAFAGKQYINRTDAKENTYQKVAMSGKYTKETLALYKKSMDPSILALKSVPLVNMGIVEERFDTRSGRRYTAMKMKNPTTDSMVWVMPDGKTPVDYNLSTTDARYAKGTPENATYMRGLSDQFTKSVKEFEELDANRTSGENINERTKLVQIGPSAFGDAAAKYMIDNGVTEQAMTGIVANVYDEMVADLKNKKVKGLSQASIDGYFQRAWIESKTGNATVFMLADKKTPVPTANVRSFFETVKRAGNNSGVEILNDTQFSSFLMQDDIYKEWVALGEEEKREYNKRGVEGPDHSHKSGFMLYVLEGLSPKD